MKREWLIAIGGTNGELLVIAAILENKTGAGKSCDGAADGETRHAVDRHIGDVGGSGTAAVGNGANLVRSRGLGIDRDGVGICGAGYRSLESEWPIRGKSKGVASVVLQDDTRALCESR